MRKILKNIDIPLFILTIIFGLFGLLMIFSASSVSTILRYDVSSYYFFVRQGIFLIGSFIIGFLIILRFPTKKYGRYAIPVLLLTILALIFLFIKGKTTHEVQSWYDLRFFSLQPSEFAKTAVIVFSAVYYNILHKKRVKNIYPYLIPLGAGFLIGTLVMMQPDLGSAFIILVITFMMFISIPNINANILKVIKLLTVGGIVLIVSVLYFGNDILNSRQLSRLNFKEPCSRYVEETGYQVCNGLIAIKNGGLIGQGLGNSTQKYLYLPESHTDFIFPIIVEELGLITGVMIIIGYIIILFRLFKIAKETFNLRNSILAYGAFWCFAVHILINLLGILALIPLTGVPLPLLSYGGSSTVNFLILLFIAQRVNIENKIEKVEREIKSL